MTTLKAEDLAKLRELAQKATPGPWMRLFGERTVYDRMEDGCRGNAIVRADLGFSETDAENLDFIAAANPATILALLDTARAEGMEAAASVLDTHAKEWAASVDSYCPETNHLRKTVSETIADIAADIRHAIATQGETES